MDKEIHIEIKYMNIRMTVSLGVKAEANEDEDNGWWGTQSYED